MDKRKAEEITIEEYRGAAEEESHLTHMAESLNVPYSSMRDYFIKESLLDTIKNILRGGPNDSEEKKVSSASSVKQVSSVSEEKKESARRAVAGGPAPSPQKSDVFSPEGREQLNITSHIKELTKENKKLKEHLLNQENFIDRIRSVVAEPLEVPQYNYQHLTDPISEMGFLPVRDAILPLYDLQFGQFFERCNTPGNMNEYSEEVFSQRLANWVGKVSDCMRAYSKSHYIENLIIPLGGDMVEGDMLPDHSYMLEFHPIEQVLRVREHLKNGLASIFKLAREELGTKRIGMYCVTGNHGRVKQKKSVAPPSLNWDYLLYKILKDDLANYSLDSFEIEPGGEVFFESQGWVFRMIHGDEVKGHTGLPYYGLTRHDAKAIRLHNVIFSYLLLGHHHQPANISIGDGEHLMSGNFVGATPYSKQITAGGRPSQWIYFVSESHGVGDRSLIHLDNVEDKHDLVVQKLAA